MLFIILLSTLFHSGLQTSLIFNNETGRNFIYNTYKYDTIINLLVNKSTEQILDFYEDTDQYTGYPSRVHVSTNDSIDGQYPLFITATQQKGVSSWEIPLVVQTARARAQFDDMARTLCPHDAGPNITSENRPLIQVTTSNPHNVSVNIKLRRVRDFYIEVNKEIELNVTPSTPKYYYFSFDSNPWTWNTSHSQPHSQPGPGFLPRFNYSVPKSVMLVVDSEDDVCATVSIQNNSCPVFDNEKDMLYQGYHLTMNRKGGITLTQSMFPVGFYVVFIVKQGDEECTGASETATPGGGGGEREWAAAAGADGNGRVKNFKFRIVATISYKEYVAGALVTLALAALIAMFALVVYIPTCSCTEAVVIVEDAPGPSTSSAEEPADADASAAADATLIINQDPGGRGDEDSEADSECELNSSLPPLTVAGLCRARPRHQDRRSNRYFWSAATVAVVYALPVVQLLATYQRMVFQTGDQDLCYYNFLCAHPLGFLSDFNHVYSNVTYVILGLVFVLQVRARSRRRPQAQNQELGIPQQSGLLYSMGLALCMEGVLSACYHLCPNKMNFQFDSSFMYVIAVICMVQLYQNRHPDVNASAHATFMLLAAIMALGVVGVMYPSVYFWIVFTILHLGACCYLTLKIYYVGRFRLDALIVWRAYERVRARGRRALVPHYFARAVLLALANLANWALAAYGLYEHKQDLARHLLAVLMGNAVLYTAFYVAMKLVHRERILVHTWCYFALAHAAWALAVSLFLDSRTKWSETPANSRRHNAACSALQFYDSHDLWHAASAAALFFSFNMLLTVDDALHDTPRANIPVF